jgi:hypothetical protein
VRVCLEKNGNYKNASNERKINMEGKLKTTLFFLLYIPKKRGRERMREKKRKKERARASKRESERGNKR